MNLFELALDFVGGTPKYRKSLVGGDYCPVSIGLSFNPLPYRLIRDVLLPQPKNRSTQKAIPTIEVNKLGLQLLLSPKS